MDIDISGMSLKQLEELLNDPNLSTELKTRVQARLNFLREIYKECEECEMSLSGGTIGKEIDFDIKGKISVKKLNIENGKRR